MWLVFVLIITAVLVVQLPQYNALIACIGGFFLLKGLASK
jgi:hypothetical protein